MLEKFEWSLKVWLISACSFLVKLATIKLYDRNPSCILAMNRSVQLHGWSKCTFAHVINQLQRHRIAHRSFMAFFRVDFTLTRRNFRMLVSKTFYHHFKTILCRQTRFGNAVKLMQKSLNLLCSCLLFSLLFTQLLHLV